MAFPRAIDIALISSQLVVNGNLWNIPEILEFVSSGKKIWNELADCLEIERSPWNKKQQKEPLYATKPRTQAPEPSPGVV